MNKTTKTEIVIIILLITVFAISFIYAKVTESRASEERIDTTVTAISDVNRFFTIDSAISKYFSFVTSKNSTSLLKILDEDYIKRNNITSSNIYNFVGNYDSNIRASLEEAYQVNSYNNIYKYYVKVALKLETLYDSTLQEYVYYIVTINENELTFGIEPISESIYLKRVEEATNNG